MRGDSLRDLYAKTLALVGLGVLAGAGALVDYWPVGVHLPAAASALKQPLLAQALTVPRGSMPARDSIAKPATRLLARWTVAPRLSALPVAASSESGVGQPVGLFEPASSGAIAALPAAEAEMTSAFDSPDLSSLTDDRLPETTEASPVALATDDSTSEGLIAGALKKTGSSIVRSGVWTGTSLVDAVRAVGGAVRKALPN